MAMGLVRLVEVAFDGTRVKANASRYHTWTAAKVQEALQELDAAFDRLMSEADQADSQSREDLFAGESVEHLPAELASLEQRRQKLEQVLRTLQSEDESRRKAGKNPEKNPAQLPPGRHRRQGDAQQGRRLCGELHAHRRRRRFQRPDRGLPGDRRSQRTHANASGRGPDRGDFRPQTGGLFGRHGPRQRREPGRHGVARRNLLHAHGVVAAARVQPGQT